MLPGYVRRWFPAVLLVALVALAYGLGLHRHLSLTELAQNREQLRDFVDRHLVAAVLAYMGLYVVLVALSVPGATGMSIAGGFLFGWAISIPATVAAATAGSVIVFEIVRTSLGAALSERAGPLVQRLSRGFAANAFSYLLFLRLAPVFPFFMVNAVAGLCRVPLRIFVAATVIGIIPASVAFALLGTGFDRIIDARLAEYRACLAQSGAAACSFHIGAADVMTPELLIAFFALGAVALLPVVYRLWKERR